MQEYTIYAVNPKGQMTKCFVRATNRDAAENKFVQYKGITDLICLTKEGVYDYIKNNRWANIENTIMAIDED